MIIYFLCACSTTQKLRVQELKKQGHEVRLTRQSHQWRKEAKLYNLPLPFIVENEELKIGRPLYG